MTVVLGVVLLVAAEIAALVAVAGQIGVFPAVALLILLSLCGPWLVGRAGLGAWRRTAERLAAGATPDRTLLDGFLLLAAGLLICIPGFVTDAAALLLLLPPVRGAVRRRITRRAARSVILRFAATGRRPGAAAPGPVAPGPWDSRTVVDAGSHQPSAGAHDRPAPRPGAGPGGGGGLPPVEPGTGDRR